MVFGNEVLIYLFSFIIGLAYGSYLNSWIWRREHQKHVEEKRSVCVHCSRVLRWYENIPALSFVFLRGKCRSCKRPIPTDYFLVEVGSGLLFLATACYIVWESIISPWLMVRLFVFLALLIVIFVYDAKYKIIWTGIVWAGGLFGFVINYYVLGFTISSLLLGAVVGGGFFLLQYVVSKGRWIGGGDVRLGAMMGVWLGWPVILVALFAAYVLGALYAMPLLLLRKRGLNSEVPFGTFLAVGTVVALVWGEALVRWYVGVIGF